MLESGRGGVKGLLGGFSLNGTNPYAPPPLSEGGTKTERGEAGRVIFFHRRERGGSEKRTTSFPKASKKERGKFFLRGGGRTRKH